MHNLTSANFFDLFRPKIDFSDKGFGKVSGKLRQKVDFFSQKGVVNFYQLSENANPNYSTKFVGYRIPLRSFVSDFLRGRISDPKVSNGGSRDITLQGSFLDTLMEF